MNNPKMINTKINWPILHTKSKPSNPVFRPKHSWRQWTRLQPI